jgi:hypothetical protein
VKFPEEHRALSVEGNPQVDPDGPRSSLFTKHPVLDHFNDPMKPTFLLALLLFLTGPISTRGQFLYTVDFNGTHLDSRLYVEPDSMYGARLLEGQLELSKEEGAGVGSGFVNVFSSFYLTGDFSIAIKAIRGTGSASAGLGIQSPTTEHYQAMYRTGPWHFWAARCHPEAGCASRGTMDEFATNAVLRIRREGAIVTSEVDTGAGFVTLLQTDLGGFDLPMRLKLFLHQENPGAYPDTYTDAAATLFDDLRFESEGVEGYVPGTYETMPRMAKDRRICWPTVAGKRYQLQWAPTVDAEHWLNVGGPVIGDGSETCFSDIEAVGDERFYRVETLPQ